LTHVTVVVLAWGSQPLLHKCVASIRGSTGVSTDVVVVDNGCTDDAVATLPDDPNVAVVTAPSNLGFGGGCNLGARSARGEVVAFVNPDAIVSETALAALAAPLADPEVGITSARLRLLDQPEQLNSSGSSIHYLGIGWANGYGVDASLEARRRPITGATGAAMAMRRDTFDDLGGFTPEYFLYLEDSELSLRCWLAGMRVELIPEADVWHDYEFSRNTQKFYFLERNRLLLVSSMYSTRTLVLLAPALIAYELAVTVLSLVQGWLPEKVRGWMWIARHRAWALEHRRAVQRRRVIDDRALAELLVDRFDAGHLPMPGAARPVDWCFARYWRLVKGRL
jgi:GT2 family glycosyltransferase